MKTLVVDGTELAFDDRGAGPVVLLVHGFPLDHTMWNAQIDWLARHRYRVIAPDLRGFGLSAVTREIVTMERFADDMAGLLDSLEIHEKVVFCGLSMGGYVAWQFWRKYASRTRALILCDTRAAADTPEMAAARLEMADRVTREGPRPLIDAMTPNLFGQPTVDSSPDTLKTLRRVMLTSDADAIAAAARGMAQRPDVTAELPDITCPALVIVGELDAISTPEEMRAIASSMPDCKFVEIPDSGHMTTMEKPQEVNTAIGEFLDGLVGSPGS